MISTNKPAFRCSDETFNEIWRVCERSVWQHPGQDPVTAHADSMADHTFYWFLSIYEHYLYTGNERCVRKAYPVVDVSKMLWRETRNSFEIHFFAFG